MPDLWTDEQVTRLNAYQAAGVMHPFTCPAINHAGDSDRVLVATRAGWVCPSCDYTQNWAHDFMLAWPLEGEPPIVTADKVVVRGTGPLNETDRAIRAAAAAGDGPAATVELFGNRIGAETIAPELGIGLGLTLEQFFAELGERVKREDAEHLAILAAMPEPAKIAMAAFTMRALVAHAEEGGSFRYLIYDRMGFSPAAYVALYRAGGMDLSNRLQPTEPTEEDQ